MAESKHNKLLHKLKRVQTELLHNNNNNTRHKPATLTAIDPSKAPLHVRPHEPDMNIMITPPSSSSSNAMNDIAFEITSDHYVHPIDQPITLKNGKNLYPGDDPSALDNASKNAEIGKFISSLVKNCIVLVQYVWNLNLYLNLNVTENSKLKIHIPSAVFGVIIMKLAFSFSSSSNTHTVTPKSRGISEFMTSCFHLLLFIIVIYFIISLFKLSPASAASSSKGNEEIAFNTANAKSINIATHQRALKPKLNYKVKSSPPASHTLPKLEEFNKIGSKEFKNPSRIPIPDYDVLHRNEQRKENSHLSLNLPLKNSNDNATYVSTSTSSVLPRSNKNELIRRMTDEAREEMLKMFK